MISSCCLLLAQYALLLVFGVYGPELLDASGANKLYACASWGACFLAAPAGLCFDILGPAWPPGHTIASRNSRRSPIYKEKSSKNHAKRRDFRLLGWILGGKLDFPRSSLIGGLLSGFGLAAAMVALMLETSASTLGRSSGHTATPENSHRS